MVHRVARRRRRGPLLKFDGDSASDVSHRYLWGPQVDQLLADEQVTSTGSAGNVLWALSDNLGTIRDIADLSGSTTSVTNHRRFGAYGNLVSETNSAVDLVFAFRGKFYDEVTGLQNNLNRWYDANLGQWVSEDPIGFAAGDANVRRYVGNGVSAFTDSLGLQGKDKSERNPGEGWKDDDILQGLIDQHPDRQYWFIFWVDKPFSSSVNSVPLDSSLNPGHVFVSFVDTKKRTIITKGFRPEQGQGMGSLLPGKGAVDGEIRNDQRHGFDVAIAIPISSEQFRRGNQKIADDEARDKELPGLGYDVGGNDPGCHNCTTWGVEVARAIGVTIPASGVGGVSRSFGGFNYKTKLLPSPAAVGAGLQWQWFGPGTVRIKPGKGAGAPPTMH